MQDFQILNDPSEGIMIVSLLILIIRVMRFIREGIACQPLTRFWLCCLEMVCRSRMRDVIVRHHGDRLEK